MDIEETDYLTEGELLDVQQSTDEVSEQDVSYQEDYLDMRETPDLTEGELLEVQQSTEEVSDEDVSDEPALSPDLGWVDALYDEEDCDAGEPSFAASFAKSGSCAETARMFKLRRGLDQLDCIYQQKEHDMQKAREELIQCRQNIADLIKERSQLEKEVEQKRKAFNAAAVFRLRVRLRKLCLNLQREEELQGEINTKLKQQEVEMSELELGLNKISLVRREVQEQERNFHMLKAQKTATRLELQKKVSKNLQDQIKRQKQHKQEAALTLENECRQRAEASQVNRKIAAKYLRETTKRMQQQGAEKEQQSRELLEKRIQAVTSLKSNIAATQAGFRVQQRKAKENVQKKEQQERQLRESLQAQGIDGIRQIYQQRREEEKKEKQEEFTRRLKSKREESAARILQEEQLVKSRKRQQAPIPPANRRLSSLRKAKDKLLNYLDHGHASASEERPAVYRQFTDTCSSSSASSVFDLEEAAKYQQDLTEYLAEPEFSGLWEQEDYQKPVDKKTLVENEVKQEVAEVAPEQPTKEEKKSHGKKSKKASFICKPPVIHFKDFDVGKIYRKKVVLTNTSYATNSCRLLGVSAHLKDLVSINFEPPGFLSTGMSCDMQTVFQPKVNEDLEGEVRFASAVGPFTVPLRCTIKKCDLEVDSKLVDFGLHVVGQTISRTITLTNKGALATHFSLDTSEGLCAETSQVQMPSQVSATESQEESFNGVSPQQQSSAPVEPGELQPDRDLQESSEEPQQEISITESSASILESDLKAPADPVQSYLDTGDIHLGKVRSGEVGPFESIKLDIVFIPTIPGEAKLNFHIKFSDAACKPIPVRVIADAVSIPVWVVQPTVDLKICSYDCLYQDSITIQSRASTALKLTFEVCPEMKKHMELLPKTGFIQAHSSFNVQLKFLPRPSLPKDAKKYFDSDTKVLEVPLTVQVASQVKPVTFTVQAIVTSSDLQFDQTEVDFGYCSIYQSVRSSVLLTNLSLLPQDFGFISIPEYIEVQPSDGFGTLLPQETMKLDLIFSAKKAKEYRFQLCCKSGMDRDFHLPCRAVGVRPPLELSHSLVKFGPTAIGDHSTALLYLSNRETGSDPSSQPRASAAKDAAATTPAAPRLFSFKPPKDGAISITPLAGSLKPGEQCIVLLTFRPVLPDEVIRDEALRLAQKAKLLREQELERRRLAELEAKKEAPVETKKGKKRPVSPSKLATEQQKEEPVKSPSPENIQPGSQLYEEAKMSLLYSFPRRFRELLVPCYVSDSNVPEAGQLQPPWSPSNTLYLKVQCSTVRPPLVIVSNDSVVDFQQVAVGEKSVKNLTIQNISRGSLDLKSSLLDTRGVFSILNAFRCLSPGEKHTLVLAFCPSAEKKCCETLELRSQKMNLSITLCGEGVLQGITCSQPGGVLDFGYVLPKDRVSHVFQLRNNSALAVEFSAQLASLRPPRPQDDADWVALLLSGSGDPRAWPTVGTQNYSGLSVFSVAPAEGSIAAGQCQDITVTFQPDHLSANYCDRLTVELGNKSKVCVMDLKGAATSQSLYLHGGDTLTAPVESLLPPVTTWLPKPPELEVKEKSITVLVTLQASYSAGVIKPAVRQLQVGCINSTPPSKKNVDFLWDIAESLQHGFSIEPCKGTFEPGSKETITVTWTPTNDFKPFEVVQTCASVTLKWEDTCIFRVILIASVSVAATD